MARREVAHRRRSKVSIGDLRDPIDIGIAQSSPRAGGKTVKTFEKKFFRYAKLETMSGQQAGADARPINKVDTQQRSTHKFTVRYSGDLSAKMIICHRGDFYEIQGITDLEGRREYEVLRCKVLGDVQLEASEV